MGKAVKDSLSKQWMTALKSDYKFFDNRSTQQTIQNNVFLFPIVDLYLFLCMFSWTCIMSRVLLYYTYQTRLISTLQKLRYHLHTIIFILLKCTIRWFLVYSRLYNYHHCLIPEWFHHPEKENWYLVLITPHYPLPIGVYHQATFCLSLISTL